MIPLLFAGGLAGAGATNSSPLGVTGTMSIVQILLQVVVGVLMNFAILCLGCVGVQHARGNIPQINDFFIPFKKFGKSAICAVIAAAPIVICSVAMTLSQFVMFRSPAIGFILLAITGVIYFFVYLGLYPSLLVSSLASVFNDKPVIDNAKLLFERLGWQVLLFGLLFLVGGFASGLGVLLLCVGILFTYPILTNILALHYIYNFPEDQPVSAG